jgi:hypothetical protein
MTCYLAGPIFVTAIAGSVLREPVGWQVTARNEPL